MRWKERFRRSKRDRRCKAFRAAATSGVEALEGRTLLASIVVNSTADNATPGDGLVTLREAIVAANNDSTTDAGQTGSGADEITFNLGGGPHSINLMTELPALNSDLDIVGPGGAADLTVRRDVAATGSFRIFTVLAGGDVALQNLTITNGFAGGNAIGGWGGGILNLGGVLAVRGCSIIDNQAVLGGGIANDFGGVLDVSDTTLLRNYSETGGALSNVAEAVATLTRCEIAGNSAAFSGGAAYNAILSILTINDSSVHFNASYDAGGIDNVDGSTLHLRDSSFNANSAVDFGGAVRCHPSSTTTIDGCTFTANQSSHGGAVYNAGLLDAEDTLFEGNSSSFGGGALDNNGTQTVRRCTFGSNVADFAGGAMWNHVNSSATVIDCTFAYNVASEGGAIENREGATLIVQGSTFAFNHGWNIGGGAIFNYFGSVFIDGSDFTGNTGRWDGGAINNNSYTVITNSSFVSNFAFSGGALWNYVGATMSVSDCLFVTNTATQGGAINNRENTFLIINHCEFESNQAFEWGGGIFNVGGGAHVTSSTFTSNLAQEGGAINTTGTTNVTDSTFTQNTANRGGALYNWFSGVTNLTNSTVYNNGAAEGGGFFNLGTATLLFDTFADNFRFQGGTGAAGVHHQSGSLQASSTAIARSVDGPDVVSNDPDFSASFSFIGDVDGEPMLGPLADNGGLTMTMMPLPGSPLLDGGDPAYIGWPYFDQRGFYRFNDAHVDIGAVEVHPPTATGIPDIVTTEDAPDSAIYLDNSFYDLEDTAAGLSYSIVGNTNPSLFASLSIDPFTRYLTLDYAADTHGIAEITLRATDTGGFSVETTFTVTVLSVSQQIELLKQQVEALGGGAQSLLSKLNLKGHNGDAGKMGAFINHVEALARTGRVGADEAGALIDAAAALLVSLG